MFWGQEFCFVLFVCLFLAVASSNEGVDIRGKVYMTGMELPWFGDLANKTSDLYKGLEEHLCYTGLSEKFFSTCDKYIRRKSHIVRRLEEGQVQLESSEFLDNLKKLLEAYKKHAEPNVAYYGEVIYVRAVAKQATQSVRILSFLLLALPCDLKEARGLGYRQIVQALTGVVEIAPSGL
ncbi:hypothetical protein T265_09486 [Opisthorchis viverrini]|uniref:Uncharacterized protein n=1 Tax=Opisthorchis viverrini TaxID=6198 RepID=A0A074ZA02_OPIVI|nr:hypothetical protein T265_09486 [Opisthorchis viverrini]KER22407.1 hypothetical protein T265_09486 [Opisthorchis viverrini]